MFKIGEFSKLTQVTIRMLRYYDEADLLKHAFIDPMTGYRMYTVEQIPVLNKIIYLRDSGFQVEEIKAALDSNPHTELLNLLDQKRTEIEKGIHIEKEKLRKIEIAKKELLEHKSEMHYQITMKSIPSYPILSLRRRIPTYYHEGDLWKELAEFAKIHHVMIDQQAFSIYHDLEYKESDVDVELCSIVKQMGEDIEDFHFYRSEPVETMACSMVYGDFSNIAGAYQAFAAWLQKNERYQMIGCSRQIVHRGPWNEENPEHYLIELQIPVQYK